MMFNFFGKQITINNKKWKQDLTAWSLLYRTEIVIAVASFILGAIIFQMNKQLTQQNLRELARLTFLNLMSVNGVMAKTIIRNYKQKQERENETKNKQHTISQEWNMW